MENIHAAAERFVNKYLKNKKAKRLHLTSTFLDLNDIYKQLQFAGHKPSGIWYGLSDSWIKWCISEQYGGIHENIYELKLDESQILKIGNLDEFKSFEDEFIYKPEHLRFPAAFVANKFATDTMNRWLSSIDFEKVAELYSGIEIAPYQWEKRLDSKWYYGWDCASGCIWNPDAIKTLNLLAHYNPIKDEFRLNEVRNEHGKFTTR